MRALLISLICLAACGCSLVPPTPSGRVLLGGQSADATGIHFNYSNDSVETEKRVDGVLQSTTPTKVTQGGYYPLLWFFGYRRGLGQGGTEAGIELVPMGFELSVYLRQALRRPVDPEDWSVALQIEALGTVGYVLSSSLAATRDWQGAEATLALRGGAMSHPVYGPGTGWGPSQEGTVNSSFIDALIVLGLGNGGAGVHPFKLEFMARLPTSGPLIVSDYTYSSYSIPGSTERYTRTITPGPMLALTLRVEELNFSPYAALYHAVPNRWMPRRSPDKGDAAFHMRLAKELEAADMWVDAADEYQEALRQEPGTAEAHLPLARIYVDLHEASLALYHARRALAAHPKDPAALDLLARARALR